MKTVFLRGFTGDRQGDEFKAELDKIGVEPDEEIAVYEGNNHLVSKYGVREIPCVVVVGDDGNKLSEWCIERLAGAKVGIEAQQDAPRPSAIDDKTRGKIRSMIIERLLAEELGEPVDGINQRIEELKERIK